MSQSFIDQDDLLSFGVIGVGKESAAEKWYLQRGKIGRTDAGDFGDGRPLNIEWTIFDKKGGLKTVEIHGQAGAIADRGLLHARERGDAPQKHLVKGSPLFGSEVRIILRSEERRVGKECRSRR